MNYKSLLKSKKFKIAVWGTGYIGLSTMVYFAKKKIKCVGYDINKDNVLNNISKIKKDRKQTPLVIVESTLAPKVSDKKIIPFLKRKKLIIGKNILLSIAPRRDWFIEGGKNLENLDRVYGSTDKKSTKVTKDVLSIVCKKLHTASSYKVSEMVKSVENAYRHMDITLAHQLSLAFPKDNMREVLKLVGTKWNVEAFHPGIGAGGYCIPLSSRYILSQVKNITKLSLLRETIKTDDGMGKLIANSIAKRGLKKIGILGLSYKGDLKVSVLSKVIPLIKHLTKKRLKVKLYDPYFSKKEIYEAAKVKVFNFPKDLPNFDCLIISVDHKQFKIPKKILENHTKNCKLIIDHDGAWKKYNLKNYYHLSGDDGWL